MQNHHKIELLLTEIHKEQSEVLSVTGTLLLAKITYVNNSDSVICLEPGAKQNEFHKTRHIILNLVIQTV